jgi:hypothetical protein
MTLIIDMIIWHSHLFLPCSLYLILITFEECDTKEPLTGATLQPLQPISSDGDMSDLSGNTLDLALNTMQVWRHTNYMILNTVKL